MAEVNNQDIAGLQPRINRFITEALKSNSSSVNEILPHDMARLVSFLDAIDAYHNWIKAEPQLDLPKTNPRKYMLEDDAVVADVSNESINDWMRFMVTLRDELVLSESASKASGLNEFDSKRLQANTDKARSFLVSYVSVATPLDFTETHPAAPSSGSGRGGIS